MTNNDPVTARLRSLLQSSEPGARSQAIELIQSVGPMADPLLDSLTRTEPDGTLQVFGTTLSGPLLSLLLERGSVDPERVRRLPALLAPDRMLLGLTRLFPHLRGLTLLDLPVGEVMHLPRRLERLTLSWRGSGGELLERLAGHYKNGELRALRLLGSVERVQALAQVVGLRALRIGGRTPVSGWEFIEGLRQLSVPALDTRARGGRLSQLRVGWARGPLARFPSVERLDLGTLGDGVEAALPEGLRWLRVRRPMDETHPLAGHSALRSVFWSGAQDAVPAQVEEVDHAEPDPAVLWQDASPSARGLRRWLRPLRGRLLGDEPILEETERSAQALRLHCFLAPRLEAGARFRLRIPGGRAWGDHASAGTGSPVGVARRLGALMGVPLADAVTLFRAARDDALVALTADDAELLNGLFAAAHLYLERDRGGLELLEPGEGQPPT